MKQVKEEPEGRSTNLVSLEKQSLKWSRVGRLSAKAIATFVVFATAASSGLYRSRGKPARRHLRHCSDARPPGDSGDGAGSGSAGVCTEGRRQD